MPALEVGAPNKINPAQSGGYREAGIQADQIKFRNLVHITLGELQTAQTNLETLQE